MRIGIMARRSLRSVPRRAPLKEAEFVVRHSGLAGIQAFQAPGHRLPAVAGTGFADVANKSSFFNY
jgi:hypothetical protein